MQWKNPAVAAKFMGYLLIDRREESCYNRRTAAAYFIGLDHRYIGLLYMLLKVRVKLFFMTTNYQFSWNSFSSIDQCHSPVCCS
jgi:hypothetical protein